MSEQNDDYENQVLTYLGKLEGYEVAEFFCKLRKEFCKYCGRRQPKVGLQCQCWNDE